jgi:hypothetical protein
MKMGREGMVSFLEDSILVCSLVWNLDIFSKSDIIWLQEILETQGKTRGDRINNRIDE